MKNSFIYECAETIVQSDYNFNEICIIVPNDRTRIYLNAAFAQIKKKAQWAPKTLAISDVAQSLTGLHLGNKTTLIFKLYDIFKENFAHKKNLNYNLESFYGLGEILINDFNEADNWLVDPEVIFKNIKHISEIDKLYEYLSENQKQTLKEYHLLFSEEQRSKEKEKTYQLRSILPELYKIFTTKLLKDKIAYSGLIMRKMTETLNPQNNKLRQFKKWFFIGFNALTKAELSLVKYLMTENLAEYLQDTDPYYLNDEKQEAGHFLRINKKALKLNTENQIQRIPAKGQTTDRVIKIYPVPQNIAQSKIVPKLLENIKNPGAETAVIPADESMMMPILHALPQQVKEVNVSMGIPLKETKLFGLIQQYLKIHKNDDIGITTKNYSYSLLTTLLRNPLVHAITAEKSDALLKKMEQENLSVMPIKTLIESQEELFKVLFAVIPRENAGIIFLTNLLNLLFLIFQRKDDDELQAEETLENEAIHLCYKNIKKLKELLELRSESFSIAFTSRLLMKIIGELSVPFRGKKVSGLQLIGVLETRNLDFENLILLGMNEGQFPKIRHYNGFLSYSIRHAFDLPLVQHQDAVYAYLFYRLLHRSKNISIVYNSLPDEKTGEMSRFIKQLQYESGFKIEVHNFFQQVKIEKINPLSIPKSKEVMKKLNEFNLKANINARRLSASALNILIACRLHFYFRYIAKLKALSLPEEEISPALFGSILHKAAELLYSKINENKKFIEKKQIEQSRKEVKKYISQAYEIIYKNIPDKEVFLEGKGKIIIEVLCHYMNLIIDQDIKYVPFRIEGLEEEQLAATFEFETEDGLKEVIFSGIIDRIDCKDGVYRIIDYKTGSTDKSFKNFEELFSDKSISRKKAIVQMYLYGIMVNQNINLPKLTAGIYDLKQMSKSNFSPYISISKKDKTYSDENFFMESFNDFTTELKNILSDLFNPNIDFTQTEYEENCLYCPYKSICSKD